MHEYPEPLSTHVAPFLQTPASHASNSYWQPTLFIKKKIMKKFFKMKKKKKKIEPKKLPGVIFWTSTI